MNESTHGTEFIFDPIKTSFRGDAQMNRYHIALKKKPHKKEPGAQKKPENLVIKDINNMTIKEFRKLPFRENWSEDLECDSIIILPMGKRRLHDSGYRCMDFVAVKEGKPICRLAGGSDAIHLEGIGGLGYRWFEKYGTIPDT